MAARLGERAVWVSFERNNTIVSSWFADTYRYIEVYRDVYVAIVFTLVSSHALVYAGSTKIFALIQSQVLFEARANASCSRGQVDKFAG